MKPFKQGDDIENSQVVAYIHQLHLTSIFLRAGSSMLKFYRLFQQDAHDNAHGAEASGVWAEQITSHALSPLAKQIKLVPTFHCGEIIARRNSQKLNENLLQRGVFQSTRPTGCKIVQTSPPEAFFKCSISNSLSQLTSHVDEKFVMIVFDSHVNFSECALST